MVRGYRQIPPLLNVGARGTEELAASLGLAIAGKDVRLAVRFEGDHPATAVLKQHGGECGVGSRADGSIVWFSGGSGELLEMRI